MPAVIRLLGYNPLPEARGRSQRHMRHRISLGCHRKSRRNAVALIPARWERGEREPTGVKLGWVERSAQGGEGSDARRAG